MNRDTNEISMIIESDEVLYDALSKMVENELLFMIGLYVVIDNWNEELGEVSKHIDPAKVNGNEVYMSFCETVGYETNGWNGNEQ